MTIEALVLSKFVLILFGITFIVLALWLPFYLVVQTEHGGNGLGAKFIPGSQSLDQTLSSLSTSFSILASVGAVFVTLYFVVEKPNAKSLLFGVVTFVSFAVGALWTLYISILRPLTGIAISPSYIYLDLALLLTGLGSAALTFAFTIPAALNHNAFLTILFVLNLLLFILTLALGGRLPLLSLIQPPS